MARVDIIIPTFNRSEFLRAAIESVLNQTFEDFRILIVDDASTDDTYGLVKGFADGRITYVHNETNIGEAGSRNTGVISSNAEYIAFLDDDDEWQPEKLRSQVELMESSPSKVGIVYTGLLVVDYTNGGVLSRKIAQKRGDVYQDLIFGNVVGGPSTVLLRRECFGRVGLFDENIPYLLDYDMWIRLAKEFHFECIGEPLVKYHIHEKQISNNLDIRIRGLEIILKKYREFFAVNKKVDAWNYFELAFLYRRKGEVRKACGALRKSIEISPFHLKNYFKSAGLLLLGPKYYTRIRKMKCPNDL